MKIQQHDGVVVEVAGFRQGFAERCGRREMCHRREREAPGAVVRLPSLPPLYRPPGRRERRPGTHLHGGAAARGRLAPQGKWGAPPTLGFPTLGAGGRPMGGRPAH